MPGLLLRNCQTLSCSVNLQNNPIGSAFLYPFFRGGNRTSGWLDMPWFFLSALFSFLWGPAFPPLCWLLGFKPQPCPVTEPNRYAQDQDRPIRISILRICILSGDTFQKPRAVTVGLSELRPERQEVPHPCQDPGTCARCCPS